MARTVHVARPRVTPALKPMLAISDEDLPRHPDLAYNDGYTDAVSWGKDGFFISSKYDEPARIRYKQGFVIGMRLYNLENKGVKWR